MKVFNLITLVSLLFASACTYPDPNITQGGVDELKSLELDRVLSTSDKKFEDLVYIPIYSDIYSDKLNQNSLLSATLSIRNTSFTDSLFISTIDYYDTDGKLARSYINQPIALSPMATVNYVIEKEDTTGGPGANFIVKMNSENTKIKPIIQAIMIGSFGNHGFAFSTDGYSIE